MIAALITGHDDLSDWCFLIAAVVFLVAALLALSRRPDPTTGALIPAGLVLLSVAFLVA